MSTGIVARASRFAHLTVGLSRRAATAKGAKGKASEGDDQDDDEDEDDDESEMHGRSAVASARRRERARCAAIFAAPQAAANPSLAASLAFETKMTRRQAIKVLKSQGGGRSLNRSDRNPNLDHGPSTSSAKTSAGWDRAFVKAGVPDPKAEQGGWGRSLRRAAGR